MRRDRQWEAKSTCTIKTSNKPAKADFSSAFLVVDAEVEIVDSDSMNKTRRHYNQEENEYGELKNM